MRSWRSVSFYRCQKKTLWYSVLPSSYTDLSSFNRCSSVRSIPSRVPFTRSPKEIHLVVHPPFHLRSAVVVVVTPDSPTLLRIERADWLRYPTDWQPRAFVSIRGYIRSTGQTQEHPVRWSLLSVGGLTTDPFSVESFVLVYTVVSIL